MVTKERHNFPGPFDEKNLAPKLDESNLLLIAQLTMRLLVNHQLIPIAIQAKTSLLNKSVIKDLKVLP